MFRATSQSAPQAASASSSADGGSKLAAKFLQVSDSSRAAVRAALEPHLKTSNVIYIDNTHATGFIIFGKSALKDAYDAVKTMQNTVGVMHSTWIPYRGDNWELHNKKPTSGGEEVNIRRRRGGKNGSQYSSAASSANSSRRGSTSVTPKAGMQTVDQALLTAALVGLANGLTGTTAAAAPARPKSNIPFNTVKTLVGAGPCMYLDGLLDLVKLTRNIIQIAHRKKDTVFFTSVGTYQNGGGDAITCVFADVANLDKIETFCTAAKWKDLSKRTDLDKWSVSKVRGRSVVQLV